MNWGFLWLPKVTWPDPRLEPCCLHPSAASPLSIYFWGKGAGIQDMSDNPGVGSWRWKSAPILILWLLRDHPILPQPSRVKWPHSHSPAQTLLGILVTGPYYPVQSCGESERVLVYMCVIYLYLLYSISCESDDVITRSFWNSPQFTCESTNVKKTHDSVVMKMVLPWRSPEREGVSRQYFENQYSVPLTCSIIIWKSPFICFLCVGGVS